MFIGFSGIILRQSFNFFPATCCWFTVEVLLALLRREETPAPSCFSQTADINDRRSKDSSCALGPPLSVVVPSPELGNPPPILAVAF